MAHYRHVICIVLICNSRIQKNRPRLTIFIPLCALSEAKGMGITMKRIVILSNHHSYTYNFRKEIIMMLISLKYKVYIVLPYGEKVELLKEMGCEFIDIQLDRRGKNPFIDFKLIIRIFKVIYRISPDVVFSYTIKPNIYGGLVCRVLKTPFIPNITGLGSAFEKEGLLKKVILLLYRIAFKKSSCIFFQNSEDRKVFLRNRIGIENQRVIPGSGVNIDHFQLLDYPNDDTINFLYISRIMKEKGIDHFLDAAIYIKSRYPNTKFHILGYCEEEYESKLEQLEKEGVIKYHGLQSDVREFHKISHCTIHPTYYPEGMSNVLLESAACGRPIITTNRSGCREVVEDGVNGYTVEQQSSKDLIEKIELFMNLDYETRKQMGLNGRKKVEVEFDRQFVVDAYYDEVIKALK